MRILLIPALAITAAAPALAQEVSGPAQGFHVEAIGGWDRTQVSSGHRDGGLYGVGAGYDLRRGSLVFGIDGEASDSTAKVCAGAATAASPRVCAKAERDLYVGGRIGTMLSPRTMLYAKAGYTNARYAATLDSGSGTSTIGHSNLDGARVGAGLEYALSRQAFVRTEYRYSNYEQGVTRHQIVGGVGLHF